VSRSGFESLAAHHAGVKAMADLASPELAACAFESHLPHHYRVGCWYPASALTREHAGSIPAPVAMPL
jgi:hypothetical protein